MKIDKLLKYHIESVASLSGDIVVACDNEIIGNKFLDDIGVVGTVITPVTIKRIDASTISIKLLVVIGNIKHYGVVMRLIDALCPGASIILDNNTAHHLSTVIEDVARPCRQMVIDGQKDVRVMYKVPKTVTDMNNDKPVEIALVYKSGGDTYTESYVHAISKSIRKNLTGDYSITCLTDVPDKIDSGLVDRTVPFTHDNPGWWNKLELFKRQTFAGKRVIYFDLDTLIVDNIDFMKEYSGPFMGLRDFYVLVTLGSGVMLWDGDDPKIHKIYDEFSQGNMLSVTSTYKGGDQEYIWQYVNSDIDYVQDAWPYKVVSFKKHCFNHISGNVNIPSDASVVCFHGRPRIHEVANNQTIKNLWQP